MLMEMGNGAKKKVSFPHIVKVGHTIVKVYKTPSNGSNQFTVVHYLGEKRHRKTFSSLEGAVLFAETTANNLSRGELDVLELRSEDRLAYVRATEALRGVNVPLEIAALEYAEAAKLLVGDVSVLEAVKHYARVHRSIVKAKVAEVVAELIKAKEQDRASQEYLKDMRNRLKRFATHFQCNISSLTVADIESFLRGVKGSGRTRNNFRRLIGTLMHFAESRGYLAKGAIDFERVAVAKEESGDIEIFTVEEMRRMLAAASPELVPFLAIGAFAGLRSAELQRLDWSEVNLETGFIEVKASKAKTASRRLVPITENLKAWLKDVAKKEGLVCPYASMSKQLLWLASDVQTEWRKTDLEAKFEWKRNALRHSFISYRVAATQNVAQVALEAGNSPRMIFSNYRELVRPGEAALWFGILPG